MSESFYCTIIERSSIEHSAQCLANTDGATNTYSLSATNLIIVVFNVRKPDAVAIVDIGSDRNEVTAHTNKVDHFV